MNYMTLADFLSPIAIQDLGLPEDYYNSQFGKSIEKYVDTFPKWEEEDEVPQIAIFGVEEGRGAFNNNGTQKGPDVVRRHLYDLYQGDYTVKIVDLGNIKAGSTVKDTYVAIKLVMEELMKQNILPILIGGGQDLTYAQYTAYEGMEQRVDVAVIDSRFDLDQENAEDMPLNSQTYLNHIILHQPDYLFNLSNIGYQTYLVSKESINMYDKLFFNAMRLGSFSGKLDQAEPIIRSAIWSALTLVLSVLLKREGMPMQDRTVYMAMRPANWRAMPGCPTNVPLSEFTSTTRPSTRWAIQGC